MPRHESVNYARQLAGLAPLTNGGNAVATEVYVLSLFGLAVTDPGAGAVTRLATTAFVQTAYQQGANPDVPGVYFTSFAGPDFTTIGSDFFYMGENGFVRVDGQAAPAVEDFCLAVRRDPETTADHFAEVTIARHNPGSNYGPVVRAPDEDEMGLTLATTGSFYQGSVTGASMSDVAIRKHAANSPATTRIGDFLPNTPVAVNDTLALSIVGTTLRLFLNGTLLITRTDDTILPTQVRTGMFTNSAPLLRFSRFRAGPAGTNDGPPAPETPVDTTTPAGVLRINNDPGFNHFALQTPLQTAQPGDPDYYTLAQIEAGLVLLPEFQVINDTYLSFYPETY